MSHDEFIGHSMAPLVGDERPTCSGDLDEVNETADEKAKRQLWEFLEGQLKDTYGPLGDWIEILDSGEYSIRFASPDHDVLVTGKTLPELYSEVERFLASLPQ